MKSPKSAFDHQLRHTVAHLIRSSQSSSMSSLTWMIPRDWVLGAFTGTSACFLSNSPILCQNMSSHCNNWALMFALVWLEKLTNVWNLWGSAFDLLNKRGRVIAVTKTFKDRLCCAGYQLCCGVIISSWLLLWKSLVGFHGNSWPQHFR